MLPDEFWRLTYAEFAVMYEGYIRKHKRTMDQIVYLAWHIEAFSRQKKLPDLEELLSEKKPEINKNMTDEQMEAMAKVLNAALGGTEVEL